MGLDEAQQNNPGEPPARLLVDGSLVVGDPAQKAVAEEMPSLRDDTHRPDADADAAARGKQKIVRAEQRLLQKTDAVHRMTPETMTTTTVDATVESTSHPGNSSSTTAGPVVHEMPNLYRSPPGRTTATEPGAVAMRGADYISDNDDDNVMIDRDVEAQQQPSLQDPEQPLPQSSTDHTASSIDPKQPIADAVTRDDLEVEVAQRLISEAVIGEAVLYPSQAFGMDGESHDEILKQQKQQETRKKRGTILVLVLVLVAVVAALLGGFWGGSSNDDDNSAEQEAARKTAELQFFLGNATLTAFHSTDDNSTTTEDIPLLALSDPETPQHDALLWLSARMDYIPSSQQEQALLLETYAMATLVYSAQRADGTLDALPLALTSDNACLWFDSLRAELEVCNKDGRIIRLDLQQEASQDTSMSNKTVILPQELFFLSELRFMSVIDDHIWGGSLPTWAVMQHNLTSLLLDGNQFEGTIPLEWSQPNTTTKLEQLSLARNPMLHTQLPAEVVASPAWANLKLLRLDDSSITGTLPSELGLLSQLETFSAQRVVMEGALPSELGACTNLKDFIMPQQTDASTQLTGSIPQEIWQLPYLERLDLTYSGLLIELPAQQMASLADSLRELKVGTSRVRGTIPSEIGLLTRLEVLEVDNNGMLEGSVPTEIGALTALRTLDLSTLPSLMGVLPTQLGQLSSLEILFLYSSATISGGIPSEIGNCRKLQVLNCKAMEALSGSIPTELGLLTDLEEFEILRTNTGGPIPSELGLLTNLKTITMAGTTHTGTLPSELGQASSLVKLIVAGTSIGGTIPPEYGNMVNIDKFALDRNQLTGSLPVTFTGWQKISTSWG